MIGIRRELVPIVVASRKVLEGDWTGRELTKTNIVGSTWGGTHFILQIGYEQREGYAASFLPVFVVRMPSKLASPTDSEEIAAAKKLAESFMHMLNLRRKDPPIHDPKPPLVGKRADMLIVDEISYLIQPQPRNQP